MRNHTYVSRLTWILAVLIWAGCVTGKPLQGSRVAAKTASIDRSMQAPEKVESTSENASLEPVSPQETASSHPALRPINESPQPAKAPARVSLADSQTDDAPHEKIEASRVSGVTDATVSSDETSEPMLSANREVAPANIVIKGTPKKAEPDSIKKFFSYKPERKGIVLAGIGGIAILGGWVFVQRNGKAKGAKGKNAKEKPEAKDEMEKAWKQGGVI